MNLEKIIAVRTSKTIYKDGNRVIKLFNEDYKKDDVLNEALIQARIESTEIDIPKIESVTMVDKKWAIVSEYINGVTLAKLLEDYEEKTDEYLDLFVNLQINMHQVKPPLLNDLRDKLKRKIELTDLIATQRYDLRLRLDSMPYKNAILHGDFVPSNVIISNSGKPYILDWSHATIGHPLADVAKSYLIIAADHNLDLATKYLSLYCEKTNTLVEDVMKWVPIRAAAALSKATPSQRKFLLSCL